MELKSANFVSLPVIEVLYRPSNKVDFNSKCKKLKKSVLHRKNHRRQRIKNKDPIELRISKFETSNEVLHQKSMQIFSFFLQIALLYR